MKIAYLTNIVTNSRDAGGNVHASQVASGLLQRGHELYTNLERESGGFIKLKGTEFFGKGKAIEAFYIRIHGDPGNDGLTLYRTANRKAPCIWEINGPLEEMRTRGTVESLLKKYNAVRKALGGMVDAAICVSSEMEQYARSFLGIKRTFVLPNGSDVRLFSPERREQGLYEAGKFKVIWTGSAEYAWQGLHIVREVAERLRRRDEDILFLVTAEGDSTGNLRYLGRIPYVQMPRYIASADAGLCIYEDIRFYEKFYFSPLKLYDYMACGLPVIGNDVGQIKQVIEENGNGLLTDNAVDSVIDKIVFLKSNRRLALEMGARGRTAATEKYNWDNVVVRTEDILNHAIRSVGPEEAADEDSCAGFVQRCIMKVSVVICTYNRSHSLKRTLESLAGLSRREKLLREIIIVDNNSQDDTKEVVEDFGKRSLLNIRYVLEDRQGVSYARNRGIKEAEGEIIAFLDDDVIVTKDWLDQLSLAFELYNPAIVGGRVLLQSDLPAPEWLSWKVSIPLGEFDLGDNVVISDNQKDMIGIGANMAFKREVFLRYGLFRTDLGRKGNKLYMGEDTELYRRALNSGELCMYYPHATVYHCTGSERMKKNYIRRWFFRLGAWDYYSDASLRKVDRGRAFVVPLWRYRKAYSDFLGFIRYSLHGNVAEAFRMQIRLVFFFGYVAQMVKTMLPSKGQRV